MKVIKQSRIFKEGILVDKAEIKSGLREPQGPNKKFNRYRVDRPDAAAVIVHNKKEKTITMVKQFRYAIHDRFKGNLLEIPAGKIDKGEKPIKTAVRETYEECGYKLKEKNLIKIAEFFAAPGYTTEKFHLYYVEVKLSDKINKGGGLEEENEFIETIEMPVKDFIKALKKGKIEDAKTLVAAQWFLLNKL
jgi:nudix-type nucleoside diphosphatase (YffH/AdpP family)